MTFHISKNGVKNTKDTTVKVNQGGKVKVGGDFKNTGKVEVDIRADLEILGNVINAGDFSVKDYVAESNYKLIENAINDLDGDAKKYLQESYQDLIDGKEDSANGGFKKFLGYIKEHKEVITASVQAVLQLFYK